MQDNSSTYPNSPGKPGLGSAHGVEGGGKLLPCPFCGAPAELEQGDDHHGTWFNLGCSRHWGAVANPDEHCIGGRLFYTETETSEAEAIKAWNTRSLPTGPDNA